MDITVTPAHYTDMAGNPAKDKRYAFFHDFIDEDKAESLRQGRPIARKRIFVCIPTPGDSSLNIDRPMKEKDKLEFPNAWTAYEQKKAHAVEGTPLEMWPLMSRETVFEMKALHIQTVEQFIAIPESLTHKIMGYQTLKQKAQAFLQVAKDSKAVEEKDRRLAEQDATIRALQAQLAEVTAQVAEIQAKRPQRRGPGRPKNIDKNAVRRAEGNGANTTPGSPGS